MAQSFDDTINNLVANAPSGVDTRVGTVLRDAILSPVASEFTNVYTNIDTVSANQSVATAASQSDTDLENLAANFGLSRTIGTHSSTTCRLYRYSQPSSSIIIPQGTKVYTELSSSRVAFSTQATVTLSPTSPTDEDNGAYYVDCAVVCDDAGSAGNVAIGAISYIEFTGIDFVSNLTEATGGREAQTNEELAATIEATARGNSGTRTGYEALVRTNFSVADVQVISARDSDSVRAQYGGAIDVIVLDETKTAQTEAFSFVSPTATSLIIPTFKPLIGVIQITGYDTGDNQVVLQPGVDYDVVLDTYSINRRSDEESSKILLHITSFTPQDNTLLTVDYYYSASIPNIQTFLNLDENKVFGSNVLVKMGIEIPVNVTAKVSLLPGYNSTSVIDNVQTALSNHFNGLLLGDDVQSSDVIAVIAGVAGVDSVDVSTFLFARASAPAVSLSEVAANRQEYIRLNTATITVGA